MAISDPHDTRTFRRYVQFNADGTIASVHDFEAGTVCPLPGAVELTDFVPLDLSTLKIASTDAEALHSAVADHADKTAAVEQAMSDLSEASSVLTVAQASARGALAMAAGKVSTTPKNVG